MEVAAIRQMQRAVAGRRSMVIVEDEPPVALVIEGFATELGWDVKWVAHNELSAFDLLDSTIPTVAVLDVNLGLTRSFAVAAACRNRGIPVLFITGYTATEIPDGCGNGPVLTKPFSPEDFAVALRRCLEAEAATTN